MDTQLREERQLGVAKDEFIAGISHELKTPLTSIFGFSEYLLDNAQTDSGETPKLIGLINSECAELSLMVDDLLAAASLDSHKHTVAHESVDLRLEAAAAIQPMVRAGATIELSGGQRVWADSAHVRQIIRNLVSNAVKHGGAAIVVHLAADKDRATITVADNGSGLPPDVEERLFDRFVHGGTEPILMGSVGLGLSIARSLARSMGGDIRLVRAEGWTSFEVSLPRRESVSIEIPDAADVPGAPRATDSDSMLVGRS